MSIGGKPEERQYIILRQLRNQYGWVPEDLAKAVCSCDGVANLDVCFGAVFASSTPDDFRGRTGL